MQTTVKLYAFGYRELRTYLAAALFVVGNIVLPQLAHLIPQGLRNLHIDEKILYLLPAASLYPYKISRPSLPR